MVLRRFTFSNQQKQMAFGLALAFVLVGPNLLWILLDRQPFGGDQSEYGTVSIRLYETLTRFPRQWPIAMLEAIPHRGPGIVWLGQFFVPFGYLIGSVDKAHLVSIWIELFIGLWLVYAAVLKLTDNFAVAAFASV